MNSASEARTALKTLIAQGVDQAIRRLEEILDPAAPVYNTFVQLKARYSLYLSNIVLGMTAQDELNKQYAQISHAFIIVVDALQDSDLKPEAGARAAAAPRRGELLYHIPRQMQEKREYRCAVRVAYLKELLFPDWEAHTDDAQKNIRVAEVMSVELVSLDDEEPFSIRALHSTVQFLDENDFTEWIFLVKPKHTGEFSLALRVSVIEVRDGREVKKDVVLEQHVIVATEAPEPEAAPQFVPGGVQLNFTADGGPDKGDGTRSIAPAEQVAPPPAGPPSAPYPMGDTLPPTPAPPSGAQPPFAPQPINQSAANRPLRTVALFLAFLMTGTTATWAFTPPPTRDWWLASVKNNAEAYAEYIEKYRDSDTKYLEKAYYHKADRTNSLGDLRDYQRRYPQGQFHGQVVEKIKTLELGAVQSIRQQPEAGKIRQFVVDFPESERLSEIRQAVAGRAELLPVVESAYVSSIQARPSAQKVSAYLQDFPQGGRLAEVAAAAAADPQVLEAVQPELDKVIVQKVVSASTAAEIEALLPALASAGSSAGVKKVEQAIAERSQLKKLLAQVREAARQVEQREAQRSKSLKLSERSEIKSVGVTGSHPDTTAQLQNPSADPNTGSNAASPPPGRPREATSRRSGLDLIRIPGGTFVMGCQDGRDKDCEDNQKPAHEVTLSAFEIGKYEVTQADWRAVMGSDPPELLNGGCDECPVEGVSWQDVQQFIKTLNRATTARKKYRLPTEAEWEYAARGGNKSQGYQYSGDNNLDKVAWYDSKGRIGNTFGSQKTTRPVGGKAPNELGLYDLSGSVCEWCSDFYGDYPPGKQTNPIGPKSGAKHIVRGGSWNDKQQAARVVDRVYGSPGYRSAIIGFRLARTN